MMDPAQLAALSAILTTGSFDAAAAALNVSQSAISQRIRALEDRMGTLLILRGQPCRGTEAGLRLMRHHNDIRLLEQALARDLGGPAVARPTVRIAVNADSLATWLLPALTALPDVLFDLVIDDQDHSEALLRRAEVTAAIITRADPLQGCAAWGLGALRYRATASPAFVARHFAAGITEAALMQAPCLTFNAKDGLQRQWLRDFTGRDLAPPLHMIGSSQA
ncbi:MAG: ArgP/LysG family DNA-binding transcriptional regulator, partial [Rhodobacteraceae bacterium]|nr:ArgP/LysG family DNA-binding transcriptional regulator [Paracoccaceae bacterium]